MVEHIKVKCVLNHSILGFEEQEIYDCKKTIPRCASSPIYEIAGERIGNNLFEKYFEVLDADKK